MGPRLGIYRYLREKYPAPGKDIIATPKGTFPEHPLLDEKEWTAILRYYRENAPDTLASPARRQLPRDTIDLFEAHFPRDLETEPATLALFIDTLRQELLVSNSSKGQVEFYGPDLDLRSAASLRRPVVRIESFGSGAAKYLLTDIGSYFPSDFKEGAAWTLDIDGSGITDGRPWNAAGRPEKLIEMLGRPVQVSPADLDKNGITDYLVCAYGLYAGELAWYPDPRRKYVLREAPGAIQAEVSDANQDGRPDVWALFAQGDEGMFLFINKGAKGFEEKRLLSFPPTYGSTSFELHDFNADGHTDILYTCGDNADYSLILKPYHGVYIFLNDGEGNFEQTWFYPVNGAYKAIANDFDLDGDLDIVSIAYFADFQHQPGEALLYFENPGNMENPGKMKFIPYSVKGALAGRWIAMQAGDLDSDGDPDVVLGNFSIPQDKIARRMPGKWRNTPAFMLLKNKTR